MKKFSNNIKRVLALCLIIVMSIDVFCAAVSDNDGSAFITKSEFDSLKNNFQSQLDQYNTSIDIKIDDAIASYLAGITVSKTTTYRVEMSEANEIICVNGVLPEDWKMPNVSLSFGIGFSGNNANGEWFETWWALAGLKHERASSDHQVRNIVFAGTESATATYPAKVVWKGQSKDYVETINGVKLGETYSAYGASSDWPNYLARFGRPGNEFSVIKTMDLVTGYIKDKDVGDIWDASLWWTAYGGYIAGVDSWLISNLATSATLNVVDNKQYEYEHILNWKTATWSQLSDPNWYNTLGDNASYTQNDFVTSSSVTKSGAYGGIESRDTTMTKGSWERKTHNFSSESTGTFTFSPVYNAGFTNWYSGANGAENNNPLVSVGVLNKDYTSSNIMQWDGRRKLIRNNSIELDALNLLQGSLTGYAKKDEIFEWEPVITGGYFDTSTSTYRPVNKWRIKLGSVPFTTKDTLADATKVLKNEGQTTDYLETDNSGKCKYKFKVDADTIIYSKWWPADETICNNSYWEGALDLKQCGSYKITAEE